MSLRENKKLIQEILRNDNYIINTLKFNKELILIRKDISETFDHTKKYINIYDKPTEPTVNPTVKMQVIQIDILVSNIIPNANNNIALADLCTEQIEALLHDRWITPIVNVQYLDGVGNLTTNPNQYQNGLQFGCYKQIGGKPKA